jgi:DNA replication and repair protein RecF
LILERLSSDNFRNLEPAEYRFHPSVNLVVGMNGQGKTNLLEAIYFLATTRSFRTARTQSLVRFGQSHVFVSGDVERRGVTQTISAGADPTEARRVLTINAERVPLGRYLQSLAVVAYSAARLEIIRGGPEERRRFLDRGIAGVEPGYLDRINRFQRALKQRNALLHAIAAHQARLGDLDAWDEEFLLAAIPIAAARVRYTDRLSMLLAATLQRYRYHVTGITLRYVPGGEATGTPDDWRRRLTEVRRHELRNRMTLVGPQRDTVAFEVDGRPASEVLSGGELKTIVLFLKFAKLEHFRDETGEAAVFILDDIDAELDVEILGAVLRNLPRETQLFATSAKQGVISDLETAAHRRFTMDGGRASGVSEHGAGGRGDRDK